MKEVFEPELIKQQLSEAGWTRDDILTEQTVHYQGNRFRLDIVLLYNLYPIAIVEVKRPYTAIDMAVQQVLRYTEAVSIPFAFIADGIKVHEVSTLDGEVNPREKFPSPSELWTASGRAIDGIPVDPRIYPPHRDEKRPIRLHQAFAISRAVESILSGNQRILLSMATGTGKSLVYFQVIWKLIRSGFSKRVLYLCDRLQLREQSLQFFTPLGQDVLKLDASLMADEFHQLHVGISQHFLASSSILQSFSPTFYDLILVEDADRIESYRPVLEHFSTVIQIGFTKAAVPSLDVANYWGQPIFRYSLQEALIDTERIKPPPSFRAIRLDEIADIRMGISPSTYKITDEQPSSGIIFVKSRDIKEGGNLSFDSMARLDIQAMPLVSQWGELHEDQYLLKAGDILITRIGIRIKAAIMPENMPNRVTFSSSLIRIRVDSRLADPKDVYTFFQSESGQLVLRSISTSPGKPSTIQITPRGLRQIPIFVPDTPKAKSAPEQLSAGLRAIRLIKDEILPALAKLEHSESQTGDYAPNPEFIAAKLRELASTLAPPSLSDMLLSNYPTPIALAYRRFRDSRFNVYEQVLRLRDVFEAASYFVYNVTLADVFRRLDPKTYYVQNSGARRAYNGYSMAARLDFVEVILNSANTSNGEDLFVPELSNVSIIRTAKQLQEKLRNRISHTATAAESQQQNLLDEFQPLVEEMLGQLEFFTTYRLVRIPSYYYKHGQLMRRMEVYQGTVPYVEEESLSKDLGPIMADHNHLVLLNQDDQVLDLYPLYQLVANKETRHETHLCFFKQRKTQDQRLVGESVNGAFETELGGFDDFEVLQARILDTRD